MRSEDFYWAKGGVRDSDLMKLFQEPDCLADKAHEIIDPEGSGEELWRGKRVGGEMEEE